MKSVPLFCFAAAFATAGCLQDTAIAQGNSIVLSTPFDPSAVAFATKLGSGRIYGQLVIRQAGGDILTAAGEKVYLMPAVAYTDEMLSKSSTTSGTYANLDQRIKDYSRDTTADATGNFAFDRLAPGKYYIVTQVKRQIVGTSIVEQQGSVFYQRVIVANRPVKIVLSR
jgi:hypothetical protein